MMMVVESDSTSGYKMAAIGRKITEKEGKLSGYKVTAIGRKMSENTGNVPSIFVHEIFRPFRFRRSGAGYGPAYHYLLQLLEGEI